MAKSLFNFYLDDEEKEELQQKLVRLTGDQPKGLVASFYRVITNGIYICQTINLKSFLTQLLLSMSLVKRKTKGVTCNE